MKVLPFKIPKPERDVLVYQEDKDASFYDKLHQHEEIQISIILEGEGTLIVGDTVNYYQPKTILVIGSNVPHIFKSDTQTYKKSHMLSLFFTKSSFGDTFFQLEEMCEVQPFFKRATHGFRVASYQHKIVDLFLQIKSASKFDRFLILIALLKSLSICQYKSLSSFIYEKQYSDNEGNRMRTIFEFTMSNFTAEITLQAVSNKANMTKTAFCKYFKKRTNKSYFTFLNELRIEHASKLLLNSRELSINEIAYASGFKNISNFNRQFRKLKMCSPSQFKNSLETINRLD